MTTNVDRGDMNSIIAGKEFEKIVVESQRELSEIMEVTLTQRAKDVVKSALGRSVRSKDPLFWPAGMLMLGLMEAKELDHSALEGEIHRDEKLKKKTDDCIRDHLLLWKNKYNSRIDFIDDALAGAALIMLYKESSSDEIKEICKSTIDSVYGFLINANRDREGTLVYNSDRSSVNVFADGVGQTSLFLSAYAMCFGDAKALDLARLQLLNYKRYGMDEKSHLPYHGYALLEDGCEKKGVLSWGRAAGWLIMGLSEYTKAISILNENEMAEDELVSFYEELSDALMEYRRPKGGFSWQVQAVEGHIDISATGMILYGLMNGKRKDQKAIDKRELISDIKAVLSEISDGKAMNALSSCDDFGVHYQTYGHYPWGQGAALLALSKALLPEK